MSTMDELNHSDPIRRRLYCEKQDSYYRYAAVKRLCSTRAYIKDLDRVTHRANRRLLKHDRKMGYC
jgi:hypothetical protein